MARERGRRLRRQASDRLSGVVSRLWRFGVVGNGDEELGG